MSKDKYLQWVKKSQTHIQVLQERLFAEELTMLPLQQKMAQLTRSGCTN